MSVPSLTLQAEGFRVDGELTFDTVPSLLAPSRKMIEGGGTGVLNVDLSGVTRADSAGLVMLIEWMRQAMQGQKEIRYHRIPPQLMAIARASDLEGILPVVD